ncbi:MAG: lysophospholipid acyltransferase family protein [Desulfomonilaceae bacterium]
MSRQLTLGLIIDYFVYLLVIFLENALNVIPESWARAFGRFLGRIGWLISSDRREAVMENLIIAFGKEQSKEWIRKTAIKSFEHLGLLIVEFFLIRRWTQKQMAERIIVKGKLDYDLALLPGNHGICLLTSHFGCFEVSAATTKLLGFKTNLFATGLKNPFLTRYLFSRAGKDAEIRTFPHKGVVKDLIELLRNGGLLAMLADQRGDAERGIFVDYFGTPAPANEVFARLTIEGNARILPICTYRLDNGKYLSTLGPDIEFEPTGDRKADLTALSQKFHDLFESWLRIKPEQGFWFQRKWRRKPSSKRKSNKAR